MLTAAQKEQEMGIGCVYPNRGAMATPANLVRFAHTAEALGFDTIWTSDHIVVPTEVQSFEFIPLSFWYDAPLIARDSDRRHDPWLVYGAPSYSPVRWSSWILRA